jgi:hypothetical protein
VSRPAKPSLREALEPVLARRGERGQVARLAMLLGPDPQSPLGDQLAAVLGSEPDGLACDQLAKRVERRRSDVLAELHADPRFERRGAGPRSRWVMVANRAGTACGTDRDALGGAGAAK